TYAYANLNPPIYFDHYGQNGAVGVLDGPIGEAGQVFRGSIGILDGVNPVAIVVGALWPTKMGDGTLRHGDNIQSMAPGGAAAGPAPYSHADEQDALNVPPSDDCERIKWAIKVLEAQREWRKSDLNPVHKGTALYQRHQTRIRKIDKHLRELRKARDARCNEDCRGS
ncbi:MAG: hypothetical protein P8173_16040, partial [Gammaproteobacteria bacterium]